MQLQGSRMAVASAPVSRVRSVQCKALFGSSATKQASSEFYNFKVKVRASAGNKGYLSMLALVELTAHCTGNHHEAPSSVYDCLFAQHVPNVHACMVLAW